MSALIPGELHQVILLDCESLEDVDNFNNLDPMFIAKGLGAEEVRNRINLARSACSHL